MLSDGPGLQSSRQSGSSAEAELLQNERSFMKTLFIHPASVVEWIFIAFLTIAGTAFSQVLLQGTVRSSSGNAAIADALVEIYKIEITGADTVRATLGSTRTDQNGAFSYQIATNVEYGSPAIPAEFQLTDNYPNPFPDQTQLGLQVLKPRNYRISIFNILGQRVADVQKPLSSGFYTVRWQGTETAGVYFAVVQTEKEKKIVKIAQLAEKGRDSALTLQDGHASGFPCKASAVVPFLQIVVSKESYQVFRSAFLTFASQTLDISIIPQNTFITDVQRELALEKMRTRFGELVDGLPRIEAAERMVEFLKEQPEIKNAGASGDGNAWGRFVDGRSVVCVNNRDVDSTIAFPLLKSRFLSVINDGNPNPSNIPKSKTAIIFSTLPVPDGDYVYALTKAVGYESKKIYTIEELKQMGTPGIFFAVGHAGMDSSDYGIWTNTQTSVENDQTYKADLNAHRLTSCIASVGKDAAGKAIMQKRYAFTSQFVKDYMRFSKNSLVCIDACATITHEDFIETFWNDTVNAGVYAGFWNLIDDKLSGYTVNVFFDRLLGTNAFKNPELPYYRGGEKPPQRPFDWQSVYDWMQSEKYDYGDFTVLSKPSGKAQGGPLAPSIASMSVHPYDGTLTLYGIFGDNPGGDGQVLVSDGRDAYSLEISDWGYDEQVRMDKIVCAIPTDGSAACGHVMVKVRGIKSNITQLSRYKGDFTLTHDTGDGRRYEVKLTLQFRTHLVSYRLKPGGEPVYSQPKMVVFADMASTGESTANGAGSGIAWSGHYTGLYNNVDGSANTRSFICGAWFDPEHLKMQAYLSGYVDEGIIQTAGTIVHKYAIIFGPDIFAGTHTGFPSYFELKLAEDYSIIKGSAKATKVSARMGAADAVSIKWDDIRCDFPPSPEAPR
jgi:hypothetical protein